MTISQWPGCYRAFNDALIGESLDIVSKCHVAGRDHRAGDGGGQGKQGQYDGERHVARMGVEFDRFVLTGVVSGGMVATFRLARLLGCF